MLLMGKSPTIVFLSKVKPQLVESRRVVYSKVILFYCFWLKYFYRRFLYIIKYHIGCPSKA